MKYKKNRQTSKNDTSRREPGFCFLPPYIQDHTRLFVLIQLCITENVSIGLYQPFAARMYPVNDQNVINIGVTARYNTLTYVIHH